MRLGHSAQLCQNLSQAFVSPQQSDTLDSLDKHMCFYKGYPLSTKFPHAEISGLARRFLRDLAVGNQVCLNGLFDLASAVGQDNVRNHPRWQTILQTGSACEDSRRLH
jgi:hypothetical protein